MHYTKKEGAEPSLFLSAIPGQTIGRDSSDRSQGEKRLTFCDQDSRSDLGASSEFLREQKEGCNPFGSMQWQVQSVGLV